MVKMQKVLFFYIEPLRKKLSLGYNKHKYVDTYERRYLNDDIFIEETESENIQYVVSRPMGHPKEVKTVEEAKRPLSQKS